MPLTPLDAEKARFRVVLRGYAREEVERFRREVIAALEEHIAGGTELAGRVSEQESQLARYRESEELLKSSVVLAQRTCDELIAAAHKQADAIKHEARLEGDQIRQQLAELRAQREQFEYAFHGLLTGFRHRLEQGNPQLAARRTNAALPGGTEAELDAPAAAEDADLQPAAAQQRPVAPSPVDAEPGHVVPGVPSPPTPVVPRVPGVVVPPGPAAGAASRDSDDPDADIADFSAAVSQAAEVSEPPWPAAAGTPAASPAEPDGKDEPPLFAEDG